MSSSPRGRTRPRSVDDRRRPVAESPDAEPRLPSPPDPVNGSAVDHGATLPITITVESVVEGADAERLWETYRVAFEPLQDLAALQHMFTREEMLTEFAEPRIKKIVGWIGDEPVALGMVTNHLECVPQMSPQFLRARYPEHAARNAIYYGILVAVASPHRGLTVFNRVYMELWQVAAEGGGVLAFDICKFNRDTFDTDSLVQRIASNFPGGSVSMVDQQTWYVADLPTPIGER